MEIDAAGLLVAGARWVTYVAAWILIGAGGASLVLGRCTDAQIAVIRSAARASLVRLALAAAALWLVAAALTLAAQLYAWFGVDGLRDTERLAAMVNGTVWGHGWSDLAWAGAGLAFALAVATRARAAAPWLLPLAGAIAAWAVPFIGHGASHGGRVQWLHVAHIMGGGLWLGSLFALAVSTRVLWRQDSPAPGALRALLSAFTPAALTGAALSAGAGLGLAFTHIQPVSSLWMTSYGQTLLLKTTGVGALALLGWRNWRRWRPAVTEPRARRALTRNTIVELSIAVVVLALSALLSNLPMPMGG